MTTSLFAAPAGIGYVIAYGVTGGCSKLLAAHDNVEAVNVALQHRKRWSCHRFAYDSKAICLLDVLSASAILLELRWIGYQQ